MARRLRIHYPAALYHVILRGNGGDPIFFDDRDRYRLYLILQSVVEKFRCRIHAFCLMSNHIHLVVQVDDVPLARIMQNLSLRFTKWINYSRSRTGHLFQGRYKALLVDADAYLLELVRYIHLNPVRAGMVATPDNHSWSGHHGYLGKEFLPWLTTDLVLTMLAQEKTAAQQAYASFVLDGMGEGRRGDFHCGTCEGRILGDDAFSDEILVRVQQKSARAFSLDEVLGAVCDYYQITEAQLCAAGKVRPMTEARAVAAAIVQGSSHLRMTDLARRLGREVSALCKAAQRVTGDQAHSRIVTEVMERMRSGCQQMSESQT